MLGPLHLTHSKGELRARQKVLGDRALAWLPSDAHLGSAVPGAGNGEDIDLSLFLIM